MGNCFPPRGTCVSLKLPTISIVARRRLSRLPRESPTVTTVIAGSGVTFSACKIRACGLRNSKQTRPSVQGWTGKSGAPWAGTPQTNRSTQAPDRRNIGTVRLYPTSPIQFGQFFFPAGEASKRAELIRGHLPNEVSAILCDADEICAHRFRLSVTRILTTAPTSTGISIACTTSARRSIPASRFLF